MSVSIQLLPKGKPIKNLPTEISVDKSATAAEIYEQVAKQSRFPIYQLRITKGSDGSVIANDKKVTIGQTGLLQGSKVYVKDLGKQSAGWQRAHS